MAIYELDGQKPEFPADGLYWVADTAVGDRQRQAAYRMPASGTARCCAATMNGSRSATRSQVQDNATLHTDPGFPLTIGKTA